MNLPSGFATLAAACWICAGASSQEMSQPRLGYCYPAGGQRGSVVRVLAGGQLLGGVTEVMVSGPGARGAVVRYLGRTIRLNGSERQEVIRRLKEPSPGEEPAKPSQAAGAPKLPAHPLLNRLGDLSPLERYFLANAFLVSDRKRQPNAQIGETALIEISIDADAPLGSRELRLRTAQGLSNPLIFEIGSYPEILEPGGRGATIRSQPVADLPATWNGQIMPGEADRARFRAQAGQALMLKVQARHLTPFIADAVPGWFQAALALFDANGREVAFADDYRFDPDPVLLFRIPATGEYEWEIRDALYRGRDDFVYRITVAEQPFVTSVFPLGGKAGEPAVAAIRGWNLPKGQLPLDTESAGGRVRQTAWQQGDALPSEVTYAVDTIPESVEVEPNDGNENAQPIEIPRIVNGRIGRHGEEDAFRFAGRVGQQIVAEVLARQLHSPLDSVLKLTDAAGRVLAWNDDFEHTDGELRTDVGDVTHHADSYIRFKLPRDGVYCVRISDAQQHGGEAFAYRLRVSEPRPDFQLAITPSTINLRSGVATPVTAHVLRIDGFDGPVSLSVKDASAGFELQGAVVPAGRSSIRLTMTAPLLPAKGPVALRLVGTAHAGGRTIAREAIPCEVSTQAFLWRHLLPSDDMAVSIVNAAVRRSPPEVQGDLPVRLPRGGTVEVTVRVDARSAREDIDLRIDDAPRGISLASHKVEGSRLRLLLKAAADGPAIGTTGNLIVVVLSDPARRPADTRPARRRPTAVGTLPAIPFKIVAAGQ